MDSSVSRRTPRRREAERLVRYVHLGTGNYHHATTSVYTDYGYLSSSQRLGEDVHKLFLQLTSLTEASDMTRMLASPLFSLFDALMDKINREIQHAEAGKDARIVAKINSLNERQLIDALYAASKAGVRIDLIVRGICSLRPGVKELSENIQCTIFSTTVKKNFTAAALTGWTETCSGETSRASKFVRKR
jgi:polyphosphate kinase